LLRSLTAAYGTILWVPTNDCSWWKSGRAVEITAMTDISAQFFAVMHSGVLPQRRV